MAKRSSARINQELSEKSELRCMWAGLFSILNSCQGHPSLYKLISNRRPANTNDNSRKLDDQLASFDEECRKIQSEEANLASEKSVKNLILDDMYIDSHKNKQIRVKPQQLTKTNSELIDHPVKTHKATRKERQRAYQSSPNAASLIHQQPSTSPHVDEKTVQQAKMSVKAFIDEMFVDGKLVRRKEWTSNESMPFSDALQVLSTSNKDLFMGLLQEPNSHYPTRRNHQKSNGKPTTFSVREIKQRLKHKFGDFRKEPNRFSTNGGTSSRKLPQKRSKFGDDCNFSVVDTRRPLNSSINNAKTKEKLGTKLEPKPDRGSDIACLNETVHKKIDFSSSRFSKKHDFDVALETKRRHMSARLKSLNAMCSKRSPKTLQTILSSTEQELLLLSTRRDSQCCSGSARTRLSPYSNFPSPNERQRTCLPPRTYTEVISCDGYEEYDDTTECLSTETNYEADYMDISETGNMRSNGEPHIVETKNICHSDATVMHYTLLDSLSENETFTSTVDDLISTPTSVHDLNMSESIKYEEEHQSPVSVLEQFFTEDANNPSDIMLQTDRKRSQPRRIYFEEFSIESSSQDQSISENGCNGGQEYYISKYVRLVLQASCLNWDQLSRISPRSEELLHSSLFDEVEFLPSDYHFDHKLIFDHMNQVLLQIHRSRFCFLPWPAFVKPKNSSVPLEVLVLDEIMRKAAEFYLLPRTEERTVEQLVVNDMSDSRSWIDVRPEAERIMLHISEEILEESVLDIVLGFHS